MDSRTIIIFVVYLFLAYGTLNLLATASVRATSFALLNVAGCFALFFFEKGSARWFAFASSCLMVGASYAALRFSLARPFLYAAAVACPVLYLVGGKIGFLPSFVGISYLAFRLAYLVFEVHMGKVPRPTFCDYISFAFFPLTFLIGPISPFRYFAKSVGEADAVAAATPVGRSLARLSVGALKCFVIAKVIHPLTFAVFWFDGYHHGTVDFVTSSVCSYLYLYANFSGGCDIFIALAGLLDINVKENFENPLFARNIAQFWTRFHITLTDFMRDIVFLPATLWAGRRVARTWLPAVTAVIILVNFLLVGLWHGVGKNFVVLGLLHGAAMVVYDLYARALKRMPPAFQRLSGTLPMRVASTALTFAFISATTVLFDNDWDRVQKIFLTIYR